MFVPGRPFQPSLMFVGKVYPRVDPLNVAKLGMTLALPENIRLGWKGLPETNTQLLTIVNYGKKI